MTSKTPTFGEKFRALLATGRVANLPTVWSNVLVGVGMAVYLGHGDIGSLIEYGEHFDYWLLGFALLATSALYTGGCMLGDVRDIDFDRQHRPKRPLPAGILSSSWVFILAIALLSIGVIVGSCAFASSVLIAFGITVKELVSASGRDFLGLFQSNHLVALSLLTTLIICYAFFHKKARIPALLNMSMCRTALVLFSLSIGSSSFPSNQIAPLDLSLIASPVFICACDVGIYTILLSAVASTESNQNQFQYRILWGILMIALPFGVCVIIMKLDNNIGNHWWDTDSYINRLEARTPIMIPAIACYIGWVLFALRALKTSKPAFVAHALAGFCLLDACFAATFSTTLTVVCIMLFLCALLLQRVTPAT